ncbi:MAG: hypothetical protein MnENMB40S_21810 [Rhizobiaceae bacterium MnEN-MB40S]|nr:MAG: hypothetical protein MnENMB40S_21810 [Rhizobiaceae bacterium MnEN-MB40S]
MIINAGCVQAGGNFRAIAWAGVSIFTLAAAIGAAPSPALAACDATAPATGDTVTCGAGSPNPETDPIIAPDAKGVTVNFGEDAELRTLGSPSVQLGGGAYIYMRPGSLIADHNRIAGPSPSNATIDLGVTSNEALQTAIHETTAKVTVNKAKMADRAMNAITDLISSSVIVPPPPASGEVDGANRVDVGGGRIISDGAAAIRSASYSALSVSISDGGSVETIRANAPAILLDGTGSLAVELDNGAIVTHRRGSPAISAASGDSALDVLMYDDARVHTVGDNSPAILGPGANSVFNFEADGSGATQGRPMIATYGDNSAGILMHGAGRSTATVQFDDISSSNGPGLQTSGDNSALVDMDLGDTSSLNVAGANTSFGTRGNGSDVFDLAVGDNSDLLLLLQESTLTSEGHDSTLIEVTRGSSSIVNAVVIDSAFQTSGDGSGGLVFHVDGGDTSSDTYFLGDVTIETDGNDAPGFYIEQGSDTSSRTVTIAESMIETRGNSSAGVFIGGLGDGSALEATITDTSITTGGDDSSGLFVGGVGVSSAISASVSNINISTTGDNSGALTFSGATNDSSVASFDMADSTLATQGDNSVGLLAVPLSGSTGGSQGVVSIGNLSISTMGDGSTGVIIGDASLYDGPLPTVPDTTVDYNLADVTVSTAGNDADGVIVYGLGAGGPNSQASVSFDNVVTNTSGDNSRGIVVHSPGGPMMATLAFADLTAPSGSALSTEGDNATLIDVELGDGSSINFSAENTSFGTLGDNSEVVSLHVGDDSDVLFLAEGASFASEDDDATLVDVTRGSSSLLGAIIIDSTFEASGDGSGGLVFHVDDGDISSDTYFLGAVTVDTNGNDAPAFMVEQGGYSSSRTVQIEESNFTTKGTNSAGVYIGALGDGSVSDLTVIDTMISTRGNGSAGLFFGEAGSLSAATVSLTNVDISTSGDSSDAVTMLGVVNDAGVASFSVLDSTLATEGDNSVGLLAVPLSGSTGGSVGVVSIDNLSVSTMGDGSTGVIIGDASLYDGPLPVVPDTTVNYDLANVTVSTEGNDADGVVVYGLGAGGPNTEASVSFDNVVANTTGDNSRGIVVHSPGGSMMATLSFADLTAPSGPALSTAGANATLIDVDLGNESSINFSAENSSFGTAGDNSAVVSLHVGDSSDVLFVAEDASFTSQGDNATLVEIERHSSSILRGNFTNTTLEAVGDGSGGIVVEVNQGDLSNDTFFLGEVTVHTRGDDAPAFHVGEGGDTSSRTVVVQQSDITSEGANSAGVSIGGLGDSSAIDSTVTDTSISTQGDNAPGFHFGGAGSFSAASVSLIDVDISTIGDNSGAVALLGVTNESAVASFDMADATLTTEGDNAVGLLAMPLFGATGGSTGVVSLENLTVSTLGVGSTGVIIGDASLYDGPLPTVPDTTVDYNLAAVTVSTTGNDADGVVVYGLGAGGPNSEATVDFENVAANTTGDNSRGIVVNGPGTVVSIKDPVVTTMGDNSPAIVVPGTDSVLGLEASGAGQTTQPMIATFGDNSAGISMHGAGDSAVTMTFTEIAASSGPAFQTSGDNSTLIDVDLDGSSSGVFFADKTSFGTFGNNSDVISFHMGDNSNMLMYVQDASFTSEGDNATLVTGERGSSSFWNFVANNTTFQTLGDGSGGFVFHVDGGDASSDTYFLGDVTIDTSGNDAPAFHVEDGGSDSTRTVDLFDSNLTTRGNNSAGLYIGSLGALSASSFTVNATTIATHGDDSPGLYHGGVESGSTSLELSNLDISTVGDNSNAATHIGVRTDNSIAALDALNLTLSTEGDNSTGLMIVPVSAGLSPSAISGSTLVTSLTSVSVSTSGSGSAGVILGDAGFYGVSPSTASGSTFTHDMDFVSVETTGDDADGVVIHGLGVDATDTSSTLLLENVDITTSGDRSRGIVVNFGSQGEGSDSLTILDGIEIATTGDEAHSLVLGEGLGTELPGVDMDNTLAIGDVSVSTEGMNAHALVIGENTTLTLDPGNLGATTANNTIVNGLIETFDTLVATGEGGRAVHNEGILYGTFTVGDPIVGNLSNNGLIESADGAVGVAVQYTGATDDIFELQPMGVVIGSIEAGDGEDRFLLGGEGEQTFDVALIGTQYNDFEIFGKEDASVWTLTGTNAVAGPFTVAGGTLVNNAMLSNMAMTVGPDGRLEGNGTVGGLVIDGTVAPGNSIGVINVAGDVVFNAGSVYEVEIAAPDQADLIAATGTATINGGALDIVALDPETSYADGEIYRIVEAEAGVVRNTDFLYNQPFSLIRADVLYGADYVDLMLVADIPFTSLTSTYNQFQAASGLQNMAQTGDALTVFNEIVQLSLAPNGDEAVRQAFDLSSGEIHASAQHVVNQTFSQFSRLLRQQGAAGVMNAGLTDTMTATHGFGNGSAGDASSGQAWLAPLGGGGSIDGDGNAAALDWWSAGIAGGYENSLDVARGEAFAGFGLGYARSSATVNARLSSMEADNFQIGVYGGWANGPWSLSGSLAYLGSSVSTTRQIAFGDINRRAETDYWTNTFGFSGEAAYGFDIASGTTLSPVATLDAGWSGHGDFSETGAGALNLTGLSESWTQFDTGLGLALQHTMPTGAGDVTFEVRALWEYAFADVVPAQTMVFEGSPTAFSVLGPDAGRNRLRLGAGVAVPVSDGFKVRANYDGLFNSQQQNHVASISLNLAF